MEAMSINNPFQFFCLLATLLISAGVSSTAAVNKNETQLGSNATTPILPCKENRWGNCVCDRHITHVSFGGYCYPKATRVGQRCEVHKQCQNIYYDFGKNGTCYDTPRGSCECTDGQVVVSTGQVCRLAHPVVCEDDGICKCIEGHVPHSEKGLCLDVTTKIGEHCAESHQCQLSPSIEKQYLSECINYACGCSEAGVSEPGKDICYEKANALGDPCEVDVQCQARLGEDSVCSKDKVCTCRGGIAATGNSTRKCHVLCEDTEVKIGDKCFMKASKIGDSCDHEFQCTSSFGHFSECSSGKCLCGNKTIANPQGTSCLSRIKSYCDSDEDCVGPPEKTYCSKVHPGYWYCECRDGYISNSARDGCLPTRNEIGADCIESQQCQLNGRTPRWVSDELGECIDSKCNCSSRGVSEPGKHICYSNQIYNDNCEANVQCQWRLGKHSGCSKNGKCTCLNGTVLADDHSECIKPNSSFSCKYNYHECLCDPGQVQVGHRCYPKATKIGDMCTIDKQCQSVYFSNKNKESFKCADKEGGYCECEVSGATVKYNTNCRLAFPVFCSNEVCQCIEGHVPYFSPDGSEFCLPVQSKIGSYCLSPSQCRLTSSGEKKHNLSLSDCVDHSCACSNGAVSEPGQDICHEKASAVGDKCEVDVQCQAGLGKDSGCSGDKVCICQHGTVASANFTRCGETRGLLNSTAVTNHSISTPNLGVTLLR